MCNYYNNITMRLFIFNHKIIIIYIDTKIQYCLSFAATTNAREQSKITHYNIDIKI